MSEVINLRAARKRAARHKAEQRAAENRLLYGQPKSIRALEKAEAAKADRLIEAHRLDNTGDDK